MNTIPKGTYKPVQKMHPLSLLAQFISRAANGCLQISSSGNSWFLYLEQGQLIYASDLIDPFGRLDRHLRRLSLQVPSLVSAVRVQVRLMFETPTSEQITSNSDYQAICWLVEQQHLSPEQAATLIENLAKEVIETLLPIQTGSYEFFEQDLLADFSKFCQLDLRAIVEDCQSQMRRRQAAAPAIPIAERLSMNRFNLLSTSLTSDSAVANGSTQPLSSDSPQFSSAQFNSSQLDSAQSTSNSTPVESSELSESAEEPAPDDSQFTHLSLTHSDSNGANSAPSSTRLSENETNLPNLVSQSNQSNQSTEVNQPNQANSVNQFNQPSQFNQSTQLNQSKSTPSYFQQPPARYSSPAAPASKTYTIACIDDSPTVLQAINAFLDDKSFSVILINDPVKALMQIIRSKPDLILLDVTMPNLDGYELCSLLRKHPSFRGTPIIMVTGNTGFIDRAKAKLVGSSGYLTKPFTQSDLVKMVFKHLA